MPKLLNETKNCRLNFKKSFRFWFFLLLHVDDDDDVNDDVNGGHVADDNEAAAVKTCCDGVATFFKSWSKNCNNHPSTLKKSRCYEKGFKDNQNEEVKLVKIKITTVSCEANVVMQLSRVFKKNKEDRQTEQKQKQCCAKRQADKQTTNIAWKSFAKILAKLRLRAEKAWR